MEQFETLTVQINNLWQQAMSQAALLLLPSRLWQIGILALCIVLAWTLNRWLKPRFHEWLRTLEGRPNTSRAAFST